MDVGYYQSSPLDKKTCTIKLNSNNKAGILSERCYFIFILFPSIKAYLKKITTASLNIKVFHSRPPESMHSHINYEHVNSNRYARTTVTHIRVVLKVFS